MQSDVYVQYYVEKKNESKRETDRERMFILEIQVYLRITVKLTLLFLV